LKINESVTWISRVLRSSRLLTIGEFTRPSLLAHFDSDSNSSDQLLSQSTLSRDQWICYLRHSQSNYDSSLHRGHRPDGFTNYSSLKEVIVYLLFGWNCVRMNCSLPKEVMFSADSSIREFGTFQNCQSLWIGPLYYFVKESRPENWYFCPAHQSEQFQGRGHSRR
jgi:hypothetical protein